MKLQFPAYFENYTPKKDGSIGLRFSTQEMVDEDILNIHRMKGGFGWLLFAENEFSEKDIPTFQAEEFESKTPSKRLHNTLYVFWKTYKEGEIEWEQFYKEKMEGIINEVKKRLPAKPDDFKNLK